MTHEKTLNSQFNSVFKKQRIFVEAIQYVSLCIINLADASVIKWNNLHFVIIKNV